MKKLLSALFFTAVLTVSAVEETGFYGKDLTNIPESPRITGAAKSAVPLKVFFLIPGRVSAAVNELKCRREITPVILQTESFQKYSPWYKDSGKRYALAIEQKKHQAIEKDRLDKLKDCDVIVIAKTDFNMVPPYVKKAILDQVSKGAGLVYINHEHKKLPVKLLNLTENVASSNFFKGTLPALVSIKKGKYGKGTVYAIEYKKVKNDVVWYFIEPIAPFESDDPLLYDAYHLAVAKIMQAASGKTIPASAKTEKLIFNRWGKQVKATYPGKNLLLTRKLDQSGAVTDFSFELIDETAKNGIASVQLKKETALPGGITEATVQFSAPFTGTLEAQLLAPDKRIIGKKVLRLNNSKKAEFKMTVPDIPDLEYAPLYVTVKGNAQDESYAHVYLKRKRENNDFSMTIWAYHMPGSRLSKFFQQALKQSGVTTIMETEAMWCQPHRISPKPRELKQMQLRPAFYTTRLTGPMPTKKGYKYPCALSRWYNYQKTGKLEYNSRIQRIAAAGKDMGTVFYNLGDENSLSPHGEVDTCHCVECQARFRQYLEREYKTLAALNKEHGTKYKSWAEIKSVTLEVACEKNLTTLWLDHRLFMEEQFINYHKWAIAQVRAQDPEGVCGIEGLCYPFRSYEGFRLYDMLPLFDFFAPYPSTREIKTVKYLKKGAVTGAWFGSYEGTMTESRMRSTPWGHLFKGLNSTAWWTAGGMMSGGSFSAAAALSADFQPLPHFAWAMDEINKIRNSGLGALLVAATPEKPQIAIHYSNNSLHASTLNPDQSTWDISHKDFGEVLNSCGLNYELLSPAEITKGDLKRFKVLILPYSQAISAKEAAAMRKFTADGGMIIADWNPGIMNEHGKILEKSSLADLFPTKTRLAIHKYGKGVSVYLQDYISSFQARKQKGETDGITRGFLRLLRTYANVKPYALVNNEYNQLESYFLFQDGPYTYLCFIGPTAQSKKIKGGAESVSETFGESTAARRKIKFNKKVYVYDMFGKNQSAQATDQYTIDLKPYTGRVLILTEQPIKPFTVKAEKTTLKRGERLHVTVKDPAPVMLAEIPGLMNSCRFEKGKFTFQTAFNDKPGKYTLKITNPITQQTKNITINIKD